MRFDWFTARKPGLFPMTSLARAFGPGFVAARKSGPEAGLKRIALLISTRHPIEADW